MLLRALLAFALLGSVLATLGGVLCAQEGLRKRTSKEAIVKANTSKEIAEAVGTRIDNFCASFQAFYDGLGLDKKSDNKIVARLFDTQAEFEQYFRRTTGEDDPPLAYFDPSLNALVLYDDEANVTLRQTLFHETSHQFLERYTSDAPKWLNEGLAEYFEGWRMTPEGKLLEKRVNLFDLVLLQDWLGGEKTLAPRELVAFDDEHFDDYAKQHPDLHPYLHYATSWSLLWFSLELSKDPKDKQRIVSFLKELCSVGPSARFEVKDWNDLEKRWKEAILALQAKPVDAQDFVALAAGYAQGDDYDTAAQLYQEALAKDPKLPGVQFELGYCHIRRGYVDEAMECFTKARALAPKESEIPYWMARNLLRLDQEHQDGADPERALALAEESLALAGGASPAVFELIAYCHAAKGDRAAVDRTIRKILKLVGDEDKPYYEELAQRLKGK